MSEAADRTWFEREYQRLNRMYSALGGINRALAQAKTPGELLQRVCACVVEEGGFATAWIGWLNPQTQKIDCQEMVGSLGDFVDQLHLDAADPYSLTAKAARTGKPAVWNDFSATSAGTPMHEAGKSAGIRSGAAVPIRLSNGTIRTITIYSKDPDNFGERELDLLARVAGDIAFGLEHLEQESRRETELANERDLLCAMLDYTPDLIYFKDLDSRFIRVSRSMCNRFGASSQDMIGKSDADFFSEAHANEALEDERRIIRTGEPMSDKVERETWKQGVESWVLTAKLPLRNRKNEIIGTLGISKDFTQIKAAEAKAEDLNRKLVETSRMAGMAEVATSVLHNVGNVLNSVNISASLAADKIRNSKVQNVGKAAALLTENAGDLSGFFAGKGKQLPVYLADLAKHLSVERDELLRELDALAKNVEHIKDIVAMQQNYAKVAGVKEAAPVEELLEYAVRLNGGAIERHHVQIIREFKPVPPVLVDKHKVIQILVNLIQNAKNALNEAENPNDKRVILRVEKGPGDFVRVSVRDNGSGIKPENLPLVFQHGFTTRKDGHGFGLHSGALAAKELGGSLTALSDGPGRGATFVLEIPCEPPH